MELKISFETTGGYEQTPEDAKFEQLAHACFAERGIVKLFYMHLAGVTFPNADGSQRLPAIRQLKVGEQLEFEPDDTLPKYPNAIALRWKGSQIGYLDDRLAGQMRRDAKIHGPNWVCLFRRHTHHPETNEIVGAILCMIRLEEESKV